MNKEEQIKFIEDNYPAYTNHFSSNFYLKRKFNKFNYYVNTEVNQLIADHRNALEMSDSNSNNSPTSSEQLENQVENIC